MRTLNFSFRGEWYEIDEHGHIKHQRSDGYGNKTFHQDWLFLGGTKHHWSNRITVPLVMAFENPELLNGCLGWDKDHGTTREWGGRYCGRIPRITHCHVKEVN
jgi:hypothetical protein